MQPTFRFDEAMAQSAYTLITRTADGKWYIPNPTNHGENFADIWHEGYHARAKAFFQWVAWAKEDFINIAERLDEEHYIRGLFSPENKGGLVTSKSNALAFNIAHRQKPYWPVSLNYSAQISAKFKANNTWQSFNFGDPLRKNYDLLFSATTNIPAPFQVFWQVVNTGEEAENAGHLRGQIVQSKTAGVGGLTQKEYTSYTGVHWVECFIVKNGVCVARSGEFVVRIV